MRTCVRKESRRGQLSVQGGATKRHVIQNLGPGGGASHVPLANALEFLLFARDRRARPVRWRSRLCARSGSRAPSATDAAPAPGARREPPRPGPPHCEAHDQQLERKRSARRRADPAQGRRVQVYHSKRWLMTREAVLTRNPICVDCGERLAEHIDHVIPLAQDGPEFALSTCRDCAPCVIKENRLTKPRALGDECERLGLLAARPRAGMGPAIRDGGAAGRESRSPQTR